VQGPRRKLCHFQGGRLGFGPVTFFADVYQNFVYAYFTLAIGRAVEWGRFQTPHPQDKNVTGVQSQKWRNFALWGAATPRGSNRPRPKVLFRSLLPGTCIFPRILHQEMSQIRVANTGNIPGFGSMSELEGGCMARWDMRI